MVWLRNLGVRNELCWSMTGNKMVRVTIHPHPIMLNLVEDLEYKRARLASNLDELDIEHIRIHLIS